MIILRYVALLVAISYISAKTLQFTLAVRENHLFTGRAFAAATIALYQSDRQNMALQAPSILLPISVQRYQNKIVARSLTDDRSLTLRISHGQ